MPNYRRAFMPDGTWFVIVNLLQRHGNDLLVREIELLRRTVWQVRQKYPFYTDAWVMLPEHVRIGAVTRRQWSAGMIDVRLCHMRPITRC